MTKWILYIMFFSPLFVSAQSAEIKDLETNTAMFAGISAAVSYPVIVLPGKTSASRINREIKREMLDDNGGDTVITGTEAALAAFAKDHLREMNYKVLFNKNGVLSLEIHCRVQGMYEYEYNRYLNFNLVTGSRLTLKNILQHGTYDRFKQMMFKRKLDSLKQYQADIKKERDSNYISQDLYEECLSRVNGSCSDSINLRWFSINGGEQIQVFDDCFFPHSIQSEKPFYQLVYAIKPTDSMLNKEYLAKFMGTK